MAMIARPQRNYGALTIAESDGDCVSRAAIVRALWDAFRTRSDGDLGYSWVGFYLGPGRSSADATAGPAEMILDEREPKPACSPISLKGACGQCYLAGHPLVVRDVAALGEGYIACDPRDRSEVVVPYFDEGGKVAGVLDVDSFDVGAFSRADAIGLVELLRRTGVCRGEGPIDPIEVG